MAAVCSAGCLGAAEDVAPWDLQVHGFTSVGYLHTTENNWLDPDSTDGSYEFWEFALNATARPIDGWRFGGQIFARDIGTYDNGRLQLDWLYADWRTRDQVGISFGRVKTFGGMYKDSYDVDASRVPVFLPESIYPLRTRDFGVSVDGAKVYGFFPDIGLGSLEYGVVGGAKELDSDGSTADLFRERGFHDNLEIETDGLAEAMIQWNNPIEGLTLRFSAGQVFGLNIESSDPTTGDNFKLKDVDWPFLVASVEYIRDDWVFAGEYSRQFGRGDLEFDFGGPFPPDIQSEFESNTEGYSFTATWEPATLSDWGFYGGLDLIAPENGQYDGDDRTVRYVTAARYSILDNWLIKAEVRYVDGIQGVLSGEDGGPVEDRWWALALKTTVDF